MGVLSLLFFSQKVLLGALSFLFSMLKVVGSSLITTPKSLSTGVRFASQLNPDIFNFIVLLF
jgi:hypothetical protein